MATAEEILQQLAASDETIITIDNDLRTIVIPQTIKHLGVTNDKDITTLYFRMPKTYGDVDLSNFAIRINYMNAKNEGGVYVVTDAKTADDTIAFSWRIARDTVLYAGTVKFIVCMKSFDENDELDKEYNTTIAQLPVLEGLETSNSIVEQNPDVIEQILIRLDKIEKDAISETRVNELIDDKLGVIENGSY